MAKASVLFLLIILLATALGAIHILPVPTRGHRAFVAGVKGNCSGGKYVPEQLGLENEQTANPSDMMMTPNNIIDLINVYFDEDKVGAMRVVDSLDIPPRTSRG
jgi:hypothetical protein